MLSHPLTSLTPELKYAIFMCLPDVPSAKALALVSFSFYHTFLDAQSLILSQMLQNEMSTEMLRDSLTALQVSQIQVWSKSAVFNILDGYFAGSLDHKLHKWRLSEALAASKIHQCVEFFATEFAASALSENPTVRGANAAPTFSEMRRIKLTLHRFELYCNIFRRPGHDRMVRNKLDRNRLIRPDPISAQEQRNVFFDKFSPWEIEQLGCIHDYLVQEITTPFNDVAKHDVDWGELSIPYIDDGESDRIYHNSRKESYLARGLEFLYRLVTANTYDARHDILEEPNPEPCRKRMSRDSLSDVLRSQIEGDGVPLKYYTEEEEELHVRPAFNSDNDCGPMEAWRWAHSESTRGQFYFRRDHGPLRQRGYVMWDLKRLIDWHLTEKPVRDIISRRRLDYFGLKEKDAEWREQSESWKERSRIWQKGGRGWWAPGDESHIRWPPS